ncbi:MAG TPA: hypothetical protein DCS28_03400 [Candidatus Moranbacteria bacterium]|nr:hypothetical protein [Candidatus Moranbacteria bacterium]HAT75057.1 hypothetical protein [Candidatus Moranbacteria bacterium]
MFTKNLEIKPLMAAGVLLAILIFVVLMIKISCVDYDSPVVTNILSKPAGENISDMEKFSSEQDFKNYLDESSKLVEGYGGGFNMRAANQLGSPSFMMEKSAIDGMGAGGAPERISETNVQVAGIDEPDIVKTNGKEIYFSGWQRYYSIMRNNADRGISFNEQSKIAPEDQPQEKTNIISAFPLAGLKVESEIDKQGDLLLDEKKLVIFSNSNINYSQLGQEIIGYDVSDPESPEKKWTVKLDKNTSVITSRLRGGKIYLITKNIINSSRPCPFEPLFTDGTALNIQCADIYHPIAPTPVDAIFTAMTLDSSTGEIKNSVSFVGSSGSSIIYMSENAIYATYAFSGSVAEFFGGFVKENEDIFSAEIIAKIKKLESYDISENSKLQEITMLIEKYNNLFDNDERLKRENEMANRMSAYYKKHNRDLEKTGIVKIALENFQIESSGAVPGNLLNNFAMDEYQGNLRVATTVGLRWGIDFDGMGSGETASDVYVLDKNLQTIGQVLDLGKTERIYSARFIEDKGYIVTFRQTDPFFVLDLANPANPVLAGELKIPGYSSYLHPLDATHILGIGMEGSQVKISLFDVSDKNNPMEIDKYLLDEYWSEVSNNYHAFLLDKKHNIFFLPGSKGGYVFSYMYNSPECAKETVKCSRYELYKLKLKKAVEQNFVKRAIYINDYLYIIGEDKITVLNETDWEKISELELL